MEQQIDNFNLNSEIDLQQIDYYILNYANVFQTEFDHAQKLIDSFKSKLQHDKERRK